MTGPSPRPTREQVDAALARADRVHVGGSNETRQAVHFLAAEVRALLHERRALLDEADRHRAELAARTPQPAEPTTGDLLRAAAAGRREYAQGCGDTDNTKLQEMHDALLTQAATLDGAARVADGDMNPLYGWLPSWRWTSAMDQRVLSDTSGETVRADTAALATPVSPLPAVPDGEDAPDLLGALQRSFDDARRKRTTDAGEDVPAALTAQRDAVLALVAEWEKEASADYSRQKLTGNEIWETVGEQSTCRTHAAELREALGADDA